MLMTSVDGYIYVAKAMGQWQPVASRLAEIRVPTLIYWGDEDLPFCIAAQVLKEGIANSELVTVRGVGHSPHEEAPEVFNDALLKFLDKIGW
jgi:pimeloyl-ACP methyl ester carboxylesterase